MFPVHAQRSAARYHDFKIWTQNQKLCHGGHGLNQVLEIIQHEQHRCAQ